jgi:hypothetical protein
MHSDRPYPREMFEINRDQSELSGYRQSLLVNSRELTTLIMQLRHVYLKETAKQTAYPLKNGTRLAELVNITRAKDY